MTVELRQVKGFVLDLDGTFYLGERLLPGALEIVDFFTAREFPWLFFTNNSARGWEDYQRRLAAFGVAVDPGKIMSSGDVMIDYLKRHHAGEAVTLLGTPSLEAAFAAAGLELRADAPIAVAAFDTSLTYDKLARFCDRLRAGVRFYATHPDLNCPVEGGFIPDLGALLCLLEASTGARPIIVGKPCRPTIEAVSRRLGVAIADLAFVGDRLMTDIAAAVNHGGTGILLLSGETREEDLAEAETQPDLVFRDLAHLLEALREVYHGETL